MISSTYVTNRFSPSKQKPPLCPSFPSPTQGRRLGSADVVEGVGPGAILRAAAGVEHLHLQVVFGIFFCFSENHGKIMGKLMGFSNGENDKMDYLDI